MPVYQFPPKGDPFASEIPIWMTFCAAPYRTFAADRTRNHVRANAVVEITVPFPGVFATNNNQRYLSGSYPDIEGLFGREEEEIRRKEYEFSFTNGLSIVSFDHLETVLTPGARRTHMFSMNFVAKTPEQATAMNDIGLAFQTYMHPTAFTESLLNMGHPPLWSFYSNGGTYWDGEPLVSVLQSVDINRSPISNIPYTTIDGKPLALNIKLSFLELEPAMQTGTGSLGLLSRSERFTNL